MTGVRTHYDIEIQNVNHYATGNSHLAEIYSSELWTQLLRFCAFFKG